MDIINGGTLQTIIESGKSEEDIFVRLGDWIMINFNEMDSQINYIDSTNHVYKGKGNAVLFVNLLIVKEAKNVFFDYTFEIKDNRIRYTMKDMYYYQSNEYLECQRCYLSESYLINLISKDVYKRGYIRSISDFIEGKNTTW